MKNTIMVLIVLLLGAPALAQDNAMKANNQLGYNNYNYLNNFLLTLLVTPSEVP